MHVLTPRARRLAALALVVLGIGAAVPAAVVATRTTRPATHAAAFDGNGGYGTSANSGAEDLRDGGK